MSLADRVGRSLFVALAVGLGWGIRGDFGHLVGAMYPGAVLALALAYVSGQRSLFLWMPILAGLSALLIGSGGRMSYGMLHGYAQSDTLVNYGYGFLTLFLQGSAWGVFGGAIIGLVLEHEPMRTSEWLGLIGSALAGGWVLSLVLVDAIGFQINPPRSNDSIAYFGAAAATILWLALNNKPLGLRGALLGYIGFGLGMTIGRLLGNTANVLQEPWGYSINHWNVMETSCGFIAGFIYSFGMVNRVFPDPPQEKNISLASVYGIVFVLGIIPLWHRLSRIDGAEKITQWAKELTTYGYADPDALAQRILWMVDGVCVLGFVGAALWLVIHFQRRERWVALPVLWLSLTMLLFQNLTAMYFYYPHRDHYINMHHVFWVMMILMLAYVAIARPRPVLMSAEANRAGHAPRTALWLTATAGILAVVILLASFVNGPATMKSANTRWPRWAWTEGPFPGREQQP